MALRNPEWLEEQVGPYIAGDLRVKPVSEAWERRQYYALRQAVFAEEQHLLVQDRDERDFRAIPIVALAHSCGEADRVVGAVRIYEQEPGVWYGGRLCVEPVYRRQGMLGKALVNEAVSLALDIGCQRFLATVQAQNERYFHGLHWRTLEGISLLGRPHVLMQAELGNYPFMQRRASLRTLRGGCHD